MRPVRIQRSRREKQVSPNGLDIVYVGRPGKWGNPFRPEEKCNMCDGDGCRFCYGRGDGVSQAVRLYEHYVVQLMKHGILDLGELRGKNLSCWCKIGEVCHADVLLELANK
jgi:hypothetical protein